MKGREGRKGFSHIISIIIVFLCFLYYIQCLREYYVSPTGTTEGDCTQQSAPCSLSYAISIASIYAETTTTNIYLLPGSYQQKNDIIIKDFKDITISAETFNTDFTSVYLWTSSSNSSVFSVQSSTVSFQYLTFNSSISTPVVVDENSYIIIYFCSFENNTANSTSIGGGAIYSLSPLVISKSQFTKNYIGTNKWSYYSPLNINTNTYSPITLKGGAIFGNASINLLDTSFNENYICGSINEAYGGAIYGGYLVRIQHCTLNQNSIEGEFSSVYGGAIYTENSLTVLNSSIGETEIGIHLTLNFPQYPFIIAMGGTIYAKGKISMEFTEITFSSISITNYNGFARGEGGVIYGEDQISINDTSFTSNLINLDCSYSMDTDHHNAMAYGGAISSSSLTKIEIIRSYFENNRVVIDAHLAGVIKYYIDADGGALQFLLGDIINSTFMGNSVGGTIGNIASGSSLTGGAIGTSFANIENCLFQENVAYSTGGAIQIWNNFNLASRIILSSFITNSAVGIDEMIGGSLGGAIASVNDHNTDTILLSLEYCNFADNSAIHGDDIYVENIGYEIIDSGSYNIRSVDSVFYNPSTSVSKTPSSSLTPSPSASVSPSYSQIVEKSKSDNNNDNNNDNNSNLIIVMSVSSILGVFVIVVLIAGAIAAISIFKIRQQNKKVAHRMIGDDNYVDDHEL